MTDEEYNQILAAGVEFYSSLSGLVEKYGLEEGDIPSIVMVAAGAISAVTEMNPDRMAAGIRIVQMFWSVDEGSDLPLKARFGRPVGANN